jgi:hypothetical protein
MMQQNRAANNAANNAENNAAKSWQSFHRAAPTE